MSFNIESSTIYFKIMNTVTNEDSKPFPEKSGENNNDSNFLIELINENYLCDEIKIQYEHGKLKRVIVIQALNPIEQMNIEKLCRQFTNQDILIKIRNGKKLTVERTRIFKP